MPGRSLTISTLVAIVLTGCGAGGSVVENTAETTSPGPTAAATATTGTVEQTPRTTTTTGPSTVVTNNLVYHRGDDRFANAEGLVAVVSPTGSGPWPVVVAFHGQPSTRSSMIATARDVAEQGRVVFVPDWGHTTLQWRAKSSLTDQGNLVAGEVRCAALFAKTHAANYGGDPDRITLYGYSAGGNAALMAGLVDAEPLDACVETGPGVVPHTVVSADGDLLLGGPSWDEGLADDPNGFYAWTPWSHLDGSHGFPIHVVAVENSYGPFDRDLGSDPRASFLADRHANIDVVDELDAMGLLEDGGFSVRDSNEWAYQTLIDAGYEARLVLLPDSTHNSLSSEGRALLVETVVHAERE